jgi:hypothetical protein
MCVHMHIRGFIWDFDRADWNSRLDLGAHTSHTHTHTHPTPSFNDEASGVTVFVADEGEKSVSGFFLCDCDCQGFELLP